MVNAIDAMSETGSDGQSPDQEPQSEHKFKVGVEQPEDIFRQLQSPLDKATFGDAVLGQPPVKDIAVLGWSTGKEYEFTASLEPGLWKERKNTPLEIGELTDLLPQLQDAPLGKAFQLKPRDPQLARWEQTMYVVDENDNKLFAITAEDTLLTLSISAGQRGLYDETTPLSLTTPEAFTQWIQQYASVIEHTVSSLYQIQGKTSPDVRLTIQPADLEEAMPQSPETEDAAVSKKRESDEAELTRLGYVFELEKSGGASLRPEAIQYLRHESIDALIDSMKKIADAQLLDPKLARRAGHNPEEFEGYNAELMLQATRETGVFEYFKEKHNAQTVGDAEEALWQHKVDPEIVRVWIEADLIDSPFLEIPIREVYTELDDALKERDIKKADKL